MILQPLETRCEWRAEDVADPAAWTEILNDEEIAEVDAALAFARTKSSDLLDIQRSDFPLPTLAGRLSAIESELMNGRGFVVIRELRVSDIQTTTCVSPIGALAPTWADLGLKTSTATCWEMSRIREKASTTQRRAGNELGEIGLDFHCDGSDLVGLLCLRTGASGGASAVCNSVSLHNSLVRERPDLAAELYKPQPYDMRGEHRPGARGWYEMPVFTELNGRLFVRLIRAYILSSQRHADAPRLTPPAREALEWMQASAQGGAFSVVMDFQPGDMQFINNYHVLHGRLPYKDDRKAGKVRHLKRLWLETDALADRPPYFRNNLSNHWSQKRVISRLDALPTA